MQYGILPTVPQYYKDWINPKVDLAQEPKQCCPFHREDTPSFSYDVRSGRWSCFGACHTHGDVIDMHRRKFHFNTREEAENDIYEKYHIPKKSVEDKFKEVQRDIEPAPNQVKAEVLFCKANILATCPDDWVRLDTIMAVTPVDVADLQQFIYDMEDKYNVH